MKSQALRNLVIKYLNEVAPHSQNELARKIGIAPSTLAQFMKGKEHPIVLNNTCKDD